MKKRILSILLTLVMVIGMIPAVALAAAPAEPTNLRWEGTTAKWDAVDGAVKYAVVLNIPGGGRLFGHDQATGTEYTDFAQYMVPGMTYEFGVMAYNADNEASNNENFTWSDEYKVPGETGEITGIRWDGYTLKWDSYPGKTAYWVALHKISYEDSGQLSTQVATYTPSETECDFTYDFAKGGPAYYSVHISAYHDNPFNTMAEGSLTTRFSDVPTFIDAVEITGVAAPEFDASVAVAPTGTLPSGVNYTIQSAKWTDAGGKDMAANATFESNEEYYAEFILAPKDGCIFADYDDTQSATINGEAAEHFHYDDGTVMVRTKLVSSQATKITAVRIIGNVTSPIAGKMPEKPDFAYYNEGYTVTFVEWQDRNGSKVTDAFVEGQDYHPIFKVTPNRGYLFADTYTVTITGKEGYDVYSGNDYRLVTINMTAVAAGTLTSVNVTHPETAGSELNEAAISLPSNVGYSIRSAEFKQNGYGPYSSYTLSEGDEVEVLLTIQTTDTREFPSDVVVTVNGKPATVTDHRGAVLAVSYKFSVGDHNLSSLSITLPEEAGATLNKDTITVPSGVIYKQSGVDQIIVNGGFYSGATLNDGDEVEAIFSISTTNYFRAFPEDVTVKVNGKDATVKEHNGNNIKVSYSFSVGNFNTDLSSVSVTLPEEPGATLSASTIAVPSDVIYEQSGVDSIFVNGVKEGYSAQLNEEDEVTVIFYISTINYRNFPDNVSVTVNGKNATVEHEGSSLKITYSFTVVDKPEAPVASVPSGTSFATDDMAVAITCAEPGAEIYVGLYGNDPRLDASSYRKKWTNGESIYMGRDYEADFSYEYYTSKGKDVSLKIASVKDGVWSDVVTYTYHKIGSGELPAPTATPGNCTFENGDSIKVSLKSDVVGAVIKYSRDGGTTSYTYNSPLIISSTTDLTVWAVTAYSTGKNYFSSKTTYTYTEKVTALTGSATDGIKVNVENLKSAATLMVAQYDGSKMVDVQTMTVSADGTYTMDQLTHKAGCTYKAMLVNSTTYAPLCEADTF